MIIILKKDADEKHKRRTERSKNAKEAKITG